MSNIKINNLVDEYLDWIIEHRRDLHEHPEPSTGELRTSKKIISVLKELGLEVKTGYYKTGVVGIIKGDKPGKTIGLRFDIDALAVEEKTGLSYASKTPGVMHACGHDGHTAMGLGAARVLMKLKSELSGTVKLIFQPAEEDGPHGGGAQYMIKDGVLKNPDVDAIAGMHIWPGLNYGQVGTRVGPIMAASDPFTIDVIGKGVHASLPHEGIDPFLISSQILTNLQTIVSRNIDPFEHAVVSVGQISGGTRYSVIPERVKMEGTVRTFNDRVRKEVSERVKTIACKTAEALGGKAEVNYRFGYSQTVNDSKMVEVAEHSIREILGKENFINIERPAPTGEDFSYFAREIPGVFMWLGCKKEGEDNFPLHSPYFNFDEEILAEGSKVMVKIAMSFNNYEG